MGDTPSRGERAVLVEYLEHYRATLELKCDSLTPEQLDAFGKQSQDRAIAAWAEGRFDTQIVPIEAPTFRL